MKTKLTLRLDESVIARAKRYAASRGVSLSELVENYFRAQSELACSPEGWSATLSPAVRALADRAAPAETLGVHDYRDHLSRKHA
jgi:hypothetical protein